MIYFATTRYLRLPMLSVAIKCIYQTANRSLSSIEIIETEKKEEKTVTFKRIDIGSLNKEQKHVAIRALNGENLFISGSAGTGKSFTLEYIVQVMNKIIILLID